MADLIPLLLSLLLVDVLNPMLFALMLVAVGTNRPFANSSALLAGHTAAYFVAGIVIAMGLDKITERVANPMLIDYGIGLTVGILCLWGAYRAKGGGASKGKDKELEAEVSPLQCFGFGALLNLVGVPFAVPYLAALDQILRADLSTNESLLVLFFYNLGYALPFAAVPILVATMGERCKPLLQRINDVLIRTVNVLMPIVLFLLGLALISDAVLYFSTGSGLI